MTTKKAHAKFSASGSDRWLNCPGSISLSEKAPPGRESSYAAEGTRAHEAVEFVLKNYKKPVNVLTTMLEKKFPQEMITHALTARKYILDIFHGAEENSHLLCETKVSLEFVTKDMFGTVDAAIVEEFGALHVIDYKYGAGIPVDPEDNSQMIFYALGLAHQYDYNFSKVVLTVIQPRADHIRGPIRSWETSIETLLEWRDRFANGVKACDDPLAPFRAGDHCRFCPAAPICPAISDRAMAQAQIEFSDAPNTPVVLPAVTSIQIPKLPKILAACDSLETWIASIREHAFHALERGETIKGFKLVEKRSIRKWTDPKAIEKMARKKFGDEAFDVSLKTPAQLEKVAGKDWVESRVTSQSSGLTLVSDDDRRPAVNTIAADFTIVEEMIPTGKEEVKMAAKKTPAKKAVKKTAKKSK